MTHQVRTHTIPALVAAVNAVLDQEFTDVDAVRAACRGAWDTFLPVVERRVADVTRDNKLPFPEIYDAEDALIAAVCAGPRGTWGVIQKHPELCPSNIHTCINDGGTILTLVIETWAGVPSYAAVVSNMVNKEIDELWRWCYLGRAVNRERVAHLLIPK